MSRITALPGLLRRAPTLLRTVKHLRPTQAWAQLRHLFSGVPAPTRLGVHEVGISVSAPSTPFLSPPPHVQVRAGESGAISLELLALALEVVPDRVDWLVERHGPLFAYHLHEQDWLRHPALGPQHRAAIVGDWVERHAEGVGWDPHPISLRLLSWGKALLTEGGLPDDPALRGLMLRSMVDQAETLSRGLEVRLQANHLLSNRIGVVWAGLLLTGAAADRWLATFPALLTEFESQLHHDGAHEERSPMYHSLILESGLDLLNLARVSPRTPEGFVERLASLLRRMLRALALFTGPDGQIVLFADSAWGVAAEPALLFDYARSLGLIEVVPDSGRLAFDDAGYLRRSSGPFELFLSTGPPAPAHQPGHAHCDALAFELFVSGRRLVSDSGVHEYRPGARRALARATRSHATLAFDEVEQSEVWSAHRVGGRARVTICESGPDLLVLEVKGWARGAPEHTRQVFCEPDHLVIRDVVRAAGHPVESRLPIAPEWRVELGSDRAVCRHEAEGAVVEIDLAGGLAWSVERAPFFPSFHREIEREVLVGRGVTPIESEMQFRER